MTRFLSSYRVCKNIFFSGRYFSLTFVIVFGIITIIASGDPEDEDILNNAPIANAGLDQNTTIGSIVALDGSGSYDPDGDALTYSWSFSSFPDGSNPTLSNPNIPYPTFTADSYGQYVISLMVNDGNLDSSTDTVIVTVSTSVPTPIKIETNIDITAAYYITSWGLENGERSVDWSLGTISHSLLGGYDSSSPEIADWHIKMAVENGVNTFIIPSCRPAAHFLCEQNFEDGLLRSQYLNYIKFCMMFNNEPYWYKDIEGVTKENLTSETIDYFTNNYFSNQQYLYINDKPVVFLYHAFLYYDEFGLAALTTLVNDIRETALNAGYEIYLVGDVMSTVHSEIDEQMIQLFDAASSYNIPESGSSWQFLNGEPTVISPYADMVNGYLMEIIYFSELCESHNKDFIPPAITGLDNSIPHNLSMDNWLVQRTDSTPELFKQMLENAQKYATFPQMVIIEAWNEFHEGTILEPTQEKGFLYLEQVRNTFGIEPSEGWPINGYP